MDWVLEIGGVSIAVEGPEQWVDPFASFWTRWTGSGRAPDFKLLLEQDGSLPEPQGPLFAAGMRFQDGRCFLKASGFEGEIIPERGLARLVAHPNASLADVAYFLRTAFAIRAFDERGILFHAAGVVHRDEALAFFGPSGSGKTTVTRFSKGRGILSDDLLLLRRGAKGWDVWATPFSFYRGERPSAPLRALFRLVKASEVRLEPLNPGIALGELVAASPVVNADPHRLPELLLRWGELMKSVPVFSLRFRKDDSFWEVIDAELG